jgi:hypothetical protein
MLHYGSPGMESLGEDSQLGVVRVDRRQDFLNCKAAQDFSALAGDIHSNIMVLPSIFAAPSNLPVTVFNELDMRSDITAVGVINVCNDSFSDRVHVPGALVAGL